MKGGSPTPDTGVLRVLTSQQRATGWRRQVEVEKSLGLEKGAISSYFRNLGRAHKLKKHFHCASPVESGGRVPCPRSSTRYTSTYSTYRHKTCPYSTAVVVLIFCI